MAWVLHRLSRSVDGVKSQKQVAVAFVGYAVQRKDCGMNAWCTGRHPYDVSLQNQRFSLKLTPATQKCRLLALVSLCR